MIYITGDTHGEFDRFSSSKFPEGKELTKEDFVIITGDFGGLWKVHESKDENYWLDWLNDKPWTTLFVDGNHENFERLNALHSEKKWGGRVGVVRNTLFHLQRGHIFNLDGHSFFTFGGGYSIDKHMRTPYVSWWPEEMPSNEEYKQGLKNLEKHGNEVDYIIAHSCSERAFTSLSEVFNMHHKIDGEKQLREYFNLIEDTVEYKKWFCGHFHENYKIDRVEFLYNKIVEL